MSELPEENQEIILETNESAEQKSENSDLINTKIDKDRRICPLDDELAEMLIYQLGKELENKHLYLSFSNFFDVNGLSKLAEYYKLRSDEEELHHKWIFDYLSYNDVYFQYPAIDEIDIDIKDRLTPFQITVDKEIETTMGINSIVSKALELKDWQTFGWLMGNGPVEGKLAMEQLEEESISRNIYDIAKEEASWLTKQNAIYKFYKNS